MVDEKIGCGTYLLAWLVSGIVLWGVFNAINKTGQSKGSIMFASVFLGFFIAFVIVIFRLVAEGVKEAKERKAIIKQIKASQTIRKDVTVPQQATTKVQQPVLPMVQCQEVPQQVRNDIPVERKKYPKCNCDGCLKQESCEYGHVIYDEITKERMTLFDKFMMLGTFSMINKSDDGSILYATNEELHDE